MVGPVVSSRGVGSNSFLCYDFCADECRDSYTSGRKTRRVKRVCPPMSSSRRYAACGAVGGRLVVCGGESDLAVVMGGDLADPDMDDPDGLFSDLGAMVVSSRCEAFCPVRREWTPTAPMPTGVASAAFAAARGLLFVAGGFYTRAPGDLAAGDEFEIEEDLLELQIYDPVCDSWSRRPLDLPHEGFFAGCAAGCACDRFFYVVCGGSLEQRLLDDLGNEETHFELVDSPPKTYVLDLDTMVWHERAPLPATRDGFSAALDGHHLLVVGGGEPLALDLRCEPGSARDWKPLADAPLELSTLLYPGLARVDLG